MKLLKETGHPPGEAKRPEGENSPGRHLEPIRTDDGPHHDEPKTPGTPTKGKSGRPAASQGEADAGRSEGHGERRLLA